MSKYISVPLKGNLKRLVIPSDNLEIVEDSDGNVFIMTAVDTSYEVDMDIKNIEKLIISKSQIARGRRKIPVVKNIRAV